MTSKGARSKVWRHFQNVVLANDDQHVLCILCKQNNNGKKTFIKVGGYLGTQGMRNRVGHADASADAHRMRINAHRCASSAYCAKNDIPFFTYKLPFWLRFSKSLGPEPHQLTNISYVESGEVLSFCVNEAREYLYRYLFQGGQTHYVENILLF